MKITTINDLGDLVRFMKMNSSLSGRGRQFDIFLREEDWEECVKYYKEKHNQDIVDSFVFLGCKITKA